jgi:hypothetical protein
MQAKEKICFKSSKVQSHRTKKWELINREGTVSMKELITERVAKLEFITEKVVNKGNYYREGR